ncbi:MAG: succinate dehydrogenase, cytochrome b556 subunit [Gammaproteobacteria bacterium]|nr:succinate dehydrogenase, cytochrome b556 subunit [Gammaproteobacteria bacterium]
MAAKTADAQRPLSPFMLGQYYRFQLTSLLSITHRITGVILSVGTVFLAAWLLSAATGPASYGGFVRFARGWFGQLLLFGWSWALFYHLCNGIRHMLWDTVHAFELKDVYLGGWIVVAASLLLTAGIWVLAYL